MSAFESIEAALGFLEQAPLTGDAFELSMADGYTFEGQPDRPEGRYNLGMSVINMHLSRHDFEPAGVEQREGFQTFRFERIRMSFAAEMPSPADFEPADVRLANAEQLATRPAEQIVRYFEDHPDAARAVLVESGDKRWTPATFVEDRPGGGFRVGWYSQSGVECVQMHERLVDAVTDYFIFTLGKGRWNGQQMVAYSRVK
jgi:hypothetical protein